MAWLALRLVPPVSEDEWVGGRQVDLFDRREGPAGQALDHRARLADGADVARGGDHGDVPGGGVLERRVEAIDLGGGVAVLSACLSGGADRDHAARADVPSRIAATAAAVASAGSFNDVALTRIDGDRGARGDRVHHLGV